MRAALPGIVALSAALLAVSARCHRHSVTWDSGNRQLRTEGYTVTVNVNDYLDIYCPHDNATSSSVTAPPLSPWRHRHHRQAYVLYMVTQEGYHTCDHRLGFKRWECGHTHSPHGPIRFSEKFQRYSAFSLGYEFHTGQEYYYISTPTHHHGKTCLRMKVFVCCATSPGPKATSDPTPPPPFTVGRGVGVTVSGLDDYNPRFPKLERNVSPPCQQNLCLSIVLSLLLLLALMSC